jgi:hypothetical protein
MLRRVGIDILGDLLELRGADLASRTGDGRSPADWRDAVARISTLAARRPSGPLEPLAIGGKDIMRSLGIEEGPEVGRWLRRAQRRVTEAPEENDPERLLGWIRESREREDR